MKDNNCFSLLAPDGASAVRVKTRTLQSGLLRAEFTPDKVGTYEISVSEGSKALTLQEPLKAYVFDPLLVRVKDRAETATVGVEYHFKGRHSESFIVKL